MARLKSSAPPASVPTTTSQKPAAGPETLEAIAQIFSDCQKNSYGHKKNASLLRKLLYKSHSQKGSSAAFFEGFVHCVCCLLSIKKREQAVERCVKFVASFVAFMQEREDVAAEMSLENEFTRFFLMFLLNGLQAKDKAVRLRSCQILALSIDAIQEMDDDVYEKLRDALSDRCLDKEPAIRAQAAVAISKFQQVDEEPEEEDPVLQTLLFLMRNDQSSAVRKAVLSNIEVSKATVPYIVERIRDIDPAIRKFVYKNAMKDIGDFRVFSIADRELILTWGLHDRDSSVRNSCVDMINDYWFSQCDNNLIEFLTRLDVINSKIVEDCLYAIFETQPKLEFNFDEFFWENLTCETAILMQVYFKFMSSKKNDQEILPEISAIAKYLQIYFNKMIACTSDEDRTLTAFICGCVLKVADLLDFGDEVGRRNMVKLLKAYLSQQPIDENISYVFDIFVKAVADQNEFGQIIVTIIDQLREKESDGTNGDVEELAQDMKRLNLSSTENTLKALALMQNLLVRVQLELHNQPNLMEFLKNFLVPAIQLPDPNVQLSALSCLMQYCIIDKSLASQNLAFIVSTITDSLSLEVKEMGLKALFDMLALHGFAIFENVEDKNDFLDFILGLLKSSIDMSVKAIAMEGCSKLIFLNKEMRSVKICSVMLEMYFSDSGKGHDRLLQCLAFFFPIFCYTDVENQKYLGRCIAHCFNDLMEIESSISPIQIVGQLSDWLDIKKSIRSHADCVDFSEMAEKLFSRLQGAPNATKKLGLQLLNGLKFGSLSWKTGDTLSDLAETLAEEVSDKTTLALISKIQKKINDAMNGSPDEQEEVEDNDAPKTVAEDQEEESDDDEIEFKSFD